jgi:signal peptidase I
MLLQLINLLAWLLWPVLAVAVWDDWFRRPHRRLAAHPAEPYEPGWLRVAYGVLPVLVVAGVLRLFMSEQLDFGLVLVLVATVSGIVYGLDKWLLRPRRDRALESAGKPPVACPEPVVVDYARSFFPVALGVLILRSFLFEPFRIPSDSMMPTLLDGDFILVNKFAYGLRLPVTNTKIVSIGEPQRGDVVVFKYPPNPAQNYIKRLVGLPGDKVRIAGDRLYINGEAVGFEPAGSFNDGCYEGMQLATETLGEHRHQVLHCQTLADLSTPPLPSCNRSIDRGYRCEPSSVGSLDRNDTIEIEVPQGHYFMVGDNRDNSADSRYFGFVPEANLLGQARRIWFNWDLQRSGGPQWGRIGKAID